MRINKTCETCEFNVEGVCTGEGNYSYGQKIQDFNKECDGWGISFDYFKINFISNFRLSA